MPRAAALLTILALALPAAAQPHIWREAESAAKADPVFQSGGWGRAEYLSGGKWLFAAVEDPAKVPADGASVTFDLPVEQFGKFDVWARVGYEFARSPFRWRIDGGPWTDVKPEQFTTDLMAIADFAEVAWLKLGDANLPAGTRKLELNIPRPAKGRLLFGLDCVLATSTPFRPNGPHQPGAAWKTPADEDAEGVTFEFPASGGRDPSARRVVNLGGTWQVARFDEPGDVVDRTGPIKELPDLGQLDWKAVRVPGSKDTERPDLTYCHRLLYRCRVDVPADLAGRAFVLRFPNNALLTTVFVNGKRVGHSDTPCAAFECDATAAIKPGRVNEIVVGIKDLYYALAKVDDGKSCRWLFNYPPERFHNQGGLGPTRFADYPVLFKVRRSGILEAPTLTACGAQYVSDVFVIPSVTNKELTVEATARNSTDKPVTVEMKSVSAVESGEADTGDAFVLFPETKLDLPANGVPVTVRVKQPWKHGWLWWPDKPTMCAHETELHVGGNRVDHKRTMYGFREWGWSGRQFTLNGVPWHFRADLRHNDRESGRRPDLAAKEWRRNGQNMFRFWGDEPWTGRSQRDTLDFFDWAGIAVRRSGTFDGEVASYALVIDGKPHAALFDNWRKQLAAWVKAERNHPSILVWSLENEVTYINARNFGWLKQVEPEIKKAADEVMRLDPTRPVMIDGGDALLDQSLPVAGNHYLERDKRDYPDEAYTLVKVYARHQQPRAWDPWPIPKDKPLFLGESFFANGFPPAAYAEVLGEAAFLGRREAAAGVAKFARMLSEGYRWHGVAAFHFWFAEGPAAEHYRAWQPVCVLCREWDTTFAELTTLPRTLKVFNGTRHDSPITVHWLYRLKNRVEEREVRGKRTFALVPGTSAEFTITVPTGPAGETELVLSCERDGQEVFRDVKPCRVLPAAAGKVTDAAAADVALWDPAGKVKDLVGGLTACTEVKSPADLPAGCKLLVVGPDAVPAKDATDPKWTALAAKGLRVVVFDQQHPLHYLAVPADLEPTGHTGRVAFPENPQHPAFAGLTRDDFFCWAGDHVVYRNAYRKPTRGARSLVQCDVELSNSALVECPVGDGLLLLSQLAVGGKPDAPAARAVAANLIRYAWEYKRTAKPTAVVLPDADPRRNLLTAAGVKFRAAGDPVEALAAGEVVVLDATPKNLTALAAAAEKVKAFTAGGGHLVLWGVTPEGLADFNTLVGFDHVIRPFKRERVTLPAVRPPLLAGLSIRDVALESAEKIYPWAGDRYPADDTFTHAVDLDDVAPFVKSEQFAHGWSQMTNGLTSSDSWKFIFYHDQAQAGERPSWAGTLPKAEEITGLSVVINAHYRRVTKLRVVFDGKPNEAITLDLKPEAELRQDFDFPPRTCSRIALEPLEWTEGSKPVIGIDNLWLRARRPADFKDRVVPLLNVGALVYYPSGKGGILLNQVRVNPTEPNPENAGKKQALVAALLRNLGAEFAAERLLVPGANLAYDPVPLGEKANAYLTADKGWLAGQPDLSHFPVGEQTFAGVRYDVRDFKTSPLPTAVMLAGPGAKPTEKEVNGIPVGKPTDVLFFLHTFHRVKEWRPPQPWEKDKPKDPPVVFRYTVRYSDGTTADVPVRLGVGVGHWLGDAPAGLPAASVAWAAPVPKGLQAVVYQMPWTNPKPGVAVAAIDVGYDPAVGNQYGVPVVFGITAGVERK